MHLMRCRAPSDTSGRTGDLRYPWRRQGEVYLLKIRDNPPSTRAPGRGSGPAVGKDETAFSYRDNYERLVHAKDKYDSSSLFRLNQNIKPAE